MNLDLEWKKLSDEINLQAQKELMPPTIIEGQSYSLLKILRIKLTWKLRWIRVIDLPVLACALFVRGDLQLMLLVIFACFEIARIASVYEFKKIKTEIDYTSTTQQVLRDNLKAIKNFLKIEQIWGYVFLPLAAPAGFVLYRLMIHKNFETIFSDPNIWYQLAAYMLIGFPAILITRKMNNHLFAEHIKDLTAKIHQLSTES